MNNRSLLIAGLDKATDKVVSTAISSGLPLHITKKTTIVGSTLIEKNKSGFYNVKLMDGRVLYKDIYVFEVAIIVAQRYNLKEFNIIKKVMKLEEKYAKLHMDMKYYLHCIKGAKKQNDFERMSILEDKFQSTELLAKKLRDDISFFKKMKK